MDKGVERANQTLRGVQGAWISAQKVVVENGKASGDQVDMKVTFVLE